MKKQAIKQCGEYTDIPSFQLFCMFEDYPNKKLE